MKKTLSVIALSLLALSASAQDNGRFEVHDLGNWKHHVYYTNDALGDASYIIEGKDALVTMEQPLFKDNVAEFDTYLSKLGKKVEKRITNYHVGGTGSHDAEIAEAERSLTSGAELFIGGHGGASKADAVEFKIDYLNTVKKLLVENGTPEAFVGAMKKAYPDLPGADGLEELAKALYK